MKVSLILVFSFFLNFQNSFGQDNDVYTAPCKGKFGSQKVIDSIAQKFNLRNETFYFREFYKNYDGPSLSCDTITLRISGSDIHVITTDTFLKSCSSIFFNDVSNISVKYLRIEGKNAWPYVGSMEVVYILDRNSLVRYIRSKPGSDTSNFDLKNIVMEEIPFTKFTANETTEGLRIQVKLSTDGYDIKKLANRIKQKYRKVIIEKSLKELDINFSIENPNNKYCISKEYHFFYTKQNKNL